MRAPAASEERGAVLPNVEVHVEPTILDELFASKGLRLSPLHASAANDMNTISGLAHAVGEWIERLRTSLDEVQRVLDQLAEGVVDRLLGGVIEGQVPEPALHLVQHRTADVG